MLNKDLIEKIRADFPKETVQVKKGFVNAETGEQSYLTGYKPQYIIERLNDCFGHDGWDFQILEHGIEGTNAWSKGRLTVYLTLSDGSTITRFREQFGVGNYNKATPLGDAFKSSATNALEKCASLLDIGHLAYKGLVKIPDENSFSDDAERDKAKDILRAECKKCNIDKEAFLVLIKTVLKKEKEPSSLTIEEMQKMVDYLEKNGVPF